MLKFRERLQAFKRLMDSLSKVLGSCDAPGPQSCTAGLARTFCPGSVEQLGTEIKSVVSLSYKDEMLQVVLQVEYFHFYYFPSSEVGLC